MDFSEEGWRTSSIEGVNPVNLDVLDRRPVPFRPSPVDEEIRQILEKLDLEGVRIWFDLDETLLCTDYMAGFEEWSKELSVRDCDWHDGVDWKKLKIDWKLWARNRWRTGRRYCYSFKTEPMLANPVVRAMWRPGILGLLGGLKEAGAQLGLVTLSRRPRLDYFKERFPVVFASFDRVLSVEKLVSGWVDSGFSESHHPAAKRPELLRQLSGWESFNWIVDDSEAVAEAYAEDSRLIPVEPLEAFGPRLLEVAAKISGKDVTSPTQSATAVLVEDPCYLPLLVLTERMENLRNSINS